SGEFTCQSTLDGNTAPTPSPWKRRRQDSLTDPFAERLQADPAHCSGFAARQRQGPTARCLRSGFASKGGGPRRGSAGVVSTSLVCQIWTLHPRRPLWQLCNALIMREKIRSIHYLLRIDRNPAIFGHFQKFLKRSGANSV